MAMHTIHREVAIQLGAWKSDVTSIWGRNGVSLLAMSLSN